MSALLDKAIARVRELPEADQDDIASWLLEVVDGAEPDLRLSEAQIAEIRGRVEDRRAGRTALADDAAVAALWARCGL